MQETTGKSIFSPIIWTRGGAGRRLMWTCYQVKTGGAGSYATDNSVAASQLYSDETVTRPGLAARAALSHNEQRCSPTPGRTRAGGAMGAGACVCMWKWEPAWCNLTGGRKGVYREGVLFDGTQKKTVAWLQP